jgi:DNA-binding Lrp family transcriptional regulator
MKPILTVIDIDVRANHDEQTREQLLERLKGYDDPAITVLWVNSLRMRADLRVVCLANDLARLDDFLMDVIRSVPGVRDTSAFIAFDGVVRGDVIESIPQQDSTWSRRASATVMIKTQPGEDCSVYQALADLPNNNQVDVGYVTKLLHCHACDMMVLLLGERTAALSGYVMSHIRTIPGVQDTEVISTLEWKVLADTEDLIAMAQAYPERIAE